MYKKFISESNENYETIMGTVEDWTQHVPFGHLDWMSFLN